MKKSAIIIIMAVGATLLTLNYASTSNYLKKNSAISFFTNQNSILKNEVSEEAVDVSTINLPSIFSVILGLLK
jgi:hypothetical protein